MKKKLVSLLCVLLLVVGAVAGTYAWLIDSDTAVNTFEVGKVDIDLDEAKVDVYGNPLKEVSGKDVPVDSVSEADRVGSNVYKLLPGHTYVKDPTVYVVKDSETSYVRMLVEVKNMGSLEQAIPIATHADYYADGVFLLQRLCNGWDSDVWKYEKYDPDTKTYEFRYYTTVNTVGSTEDKTPLEPLFDEITVPGFVDNDGIEYLSQVDIYVTAQAVQAEIFEGDEDAAWAAFDAQYTPAP